MKVGDRVKITGTRGNTTKAVIVEIIDKSARVIVDGIGGTFTFLLSTMEVIDESR